MVPLLSKLNLKWLDQRQLGHLTLPDFEHLLLVVVLGELVVLAVELVELVSDPLSLEL